MVIEAITVSNFNDSPFCLIVNQLDLVNCIGEQVTLALEILNPKVIFVFFYTVGTIQIHSYLLQFLTGLGISSNNLGNYQIREVFQNLPKFDRLTALDISSNNLDFSFDPELCDLTADVLASLPHLDRLDLR